MYKVPIDVLKDTKDNLNKLSILLDASHKGAKLVAKEVEEAIRKAKFHIKLLEDNFNV